jgi:hypothetical protein
MSLFFLRPIYRRVSGGIDHSLGAFAANQSGTCLRVFEISGVASNAFYALQGSEFAGDLTGSTEDKDSHAFTL